MLSILREMLQYAFLTRALAAGVLVRHRKELARPDAPPDTAEVPAGGEA